MEEISPDIVLLAGGTDAGDRDIIVHNAEMLAASKLDVPIIVAGNKLATDEVESILGLADKKIVVTENIVPELDRLNTEPAKSVIRKTFIERVMCGQTA